MSRRVLGILHGKRERQASFHVILNWLLTSLLTNQLCQSYHKRTWNLIGAWFIASTVPFTGGEYIPIQSSGEGLSTFAHVTVTQSPEWANSVVLRWKETSLSAKIKRIRKLQLHCISTIILWIQANVVSIDAFTIEVWWNFDKMQITFKVITETSGHAPWWEGKCGTVWAKKNLLQKPWSWSLPRRVLFAR